MRRGVGGLQNLENLTEIGIHSSVDDHNIPHIIKEENIGIQNKSGRTNNSASILSSVMLDKQILETLLPINTFEPDQK